jgi:hypothetical protein
VDRLDKLTCAPYNATTIRQLS